MEAPKVVEFISGECSPYVDYVSKRVHIGHPHPEMLKEASSLATVTSPEVVYELKLDPKFYQAPGEGSYVSAAQLEAVVYACQSHMRFFRGAYIKHPLTEMKNELEDENHMKIDEMDSEQAIEQRADENSESNDDSESEPAKTGDSDNSSSDDDLMDQDDDEMADDEADLEENDTPNEAWATSMTEDQAIKLLGEDTKEEKTFRQGFFLGDGNGTGKTRILACIISECFAIGGRKCVWFTASQHMFEGIRMPVIHFLSDRVEFLECRTLGKETDPNAMNVVILTYHTLVDKTMKKLEAWLGDDYRGLFLFDDVHQCKNVKTSTNEMFMRLQYNYPLARVVYSTATAASEVAHLLMLPRLQLWGKGTMYGDSDIFKSRVGQRGVAGLEQLAMEMKLRGIFVSRQMPKVAVRMEEVQLSPDAEEIYYRSVQLWSLLIEYRQKLNSKHVLVNKKSRGSLFQACQSFFGSLITSAKIPKLEQLTRQELEKNKSVVIGLQLIGENAFDEWSAHNWNSGMAFSNALHILQSAMLDLGINLGCPRTYLKTGEMIKTTQEEWTDAGSANDAEFAANMRPTMQLTAEDFAIISKQVNMSSESAPENATIVKWPLYSVGYFTNKKGLESPACISWSFAEVRHHVSLDGFARLYHELSLLLPVNPLDEIINRFENPLANLQQEGSIAQKPYEVAELTSRRRIYLFDEKEMRWTTKARQASTKIEWKNFMGIYGPNNLKRIAVLSKCASTGLSLHGSIDVQNDSERVHITVETGWSAETFLQQLGRTNRTNQRNPPEYYLLVSSIPAEKRFLSIVGKRLRRIGAICLGSPNANPHSEYMRDDIYTVFGVKAINAATTTMKEKSRLLTVLDFKPISENKNASESFISKGMEGSINSFLNRLMILPIEIQKEYLKLIDCNLNKSVATAFVYRSLRVVPAKGGYNELLNQHDYVVDGSKITVFHFHVNRCASWELAAVKPNVTFYTYKRFEKPRVVASYRNAYSQNVAIFPFNRNETLFENTIAGMKFAYKDELLAEPVLTEINHNTAQELWLSEIQEIENNCDIYNCGHKLDGVDCDFKPSKSSSQCTLSWGMAEFVIVAGYTSRAISVLKTFSKSLYLAKVSYSENGESKSVAGIYYSKENSGSAVTRIFTFCAGRFSPL